MPKAGRAAQYLRRASTEAGRILQTKRAAASGALAWTLADSARGGGERCDALRCRDQQRGRGGDEERFKRGRQARAATV